jgi:hypothetical protein
MGCRESEYGLDGTLILINLEQESSVSMSDSLVFDREQDSLNGRQ